MATYNHTGFQLVRPQSLARTGRRILLVTPQPFYDDRGTPIAVEHTARALGQLGHQVDLLAFPFGRHVNIPRVNTVRSGNPLGIQSVPIGFSWKKCVLDASLLRKFEHLLNTRRYDAIHAVEEAAYIASHVCARVGRPYIYDMASSIPAELSTKTLLGSKPAQSFLQHIEKTVIDRAAHVLCSMGLADHVRALCHSTPVTEWQFPSSSAIPAGSDVAEVRTKLGIRSADKVVVYAGNFARYQGMDLLFDAFAEAYDKDKRLLLVCVGATDNERRNCLATLSPALASRIRIVSRKPRFIVPAYLAIADCLISLRPTSKNLPLKIFEYMASAIPIVATRGPAHEPLLNRNRAYLRDVSAQSIASGILEAVSSPEKSALLGQRARTYATNQFGWNRFVDFVGGVYENVFEYASLPAAARA